MEEASSNTVRGDIIAAAMAIAPLSLSVVPFGLLVGALSAEVGLSPLDVLLMGALMLAGGAQLIAVQMWSDPLPMWAIIGVTAMVNVRIMMLSASLTPHIAHFSRPARFGALVLIVDETWAMALKRAAVARLTPAYMAGLFLPFYLNWLLWTQVGALSGALVRDPERFGIDFLYVAIFLTLLTQSWKGRSALAPVAASATASLAAYQVLPGATYIIAGGLAGCLAVLLPLGRKAPEPVPDPSAEL